MSMHAIGRLLIVLFAAILLAGQAWALVAVPPLSAHVIDQVGLLTPAQRAALDDMLNNVEQRSGSQIAVLLIDKTEPEAIEQFGIRVADAWKLGRKGIDDGVILIVAKNNPKALRRLRIEAGRGVQGSLTDAQSKRILQDVIAPYFQRSDFNGGLAAGVSAIVGLLDKEALPAARNSQANENNAASGGALALSPFLLFAFIVVIGIVTSRLRGMGRTLNRSGWGRGAGVILGSGIGSGLGGHGGSVGGGFSGGGGGFDGGGASGDW